MTLDINLRIISLFGAGRMGAEVATHTECGLSDFSVKWNIVAVGFAYYSLLLFIFF